MLHLDQNAKTQKLAASMSAIKLMALTESLSTNKLAEKNNQKSHLTIDA